MHAKRRRRGAGSGRSEVAMAINASEDRERLLTLARRVKKYHGGSEIGKR